MQLRIGELSEQTGCAIETIRYYERIGVLPVAPRSANGYRRYDDSHRARLTFILRARELGFTLDEIHTLLSLVKGGDYTCAGIQALTREHLAEIRRKIADLQRLDRMLSGMLSQCSGEAVPECPIIDELSADRAV